MKAIRESLSIEGQDGVVPLLRPPTFDGQNEDQEDKPSQTLEAPTSKSDPNLKEDKVLTNKLRFDR